MLSASKIKKLVDNTPLLQSVMDKRRVSWINPNRKLQKDFPNFPISMADMKEAEELWNRFAPYFAVAFPETKSTKGILESPLVEIPEMKKYLEAEAGMFQGKLFLKCDNALPIAGSIKARGGFFEVLHYAETLAIQKGLISKEDDYSRFYSEEFLNYFNQYRIGVGSTGNLGLSIGIIGAKLGFEVTVYMSSDAKEWKKNLLRKSGVKVEEFAGDFSEAILAGRQKTKADPKGYFVDDENSYELFLGYTVGALRLARQLKEQNIQVDENHPLIVYSPCGVGGSPGGTAFGLCQIFGDNVHCFFVEPTHSPAVLTGLITEEMSNISVQDIGVDNITEADGLAVGRPSHFATKISRDIISGIYTIEDEELFRLLAQLQDSETIFLEPSATAGLIGPQRISSETDYFKNLPMENATHIVWATGGDLVPEENRKKFYERGKHNKSAG